MILFITIKYKMDKTTICVIVRTKNEVDIIEVLNVTLQYATDYIIYDHHSTDNTVMLCDQFFKDHNIEGQVFYNKSNRLSDQDLLDLGKYTISTYLWLYDTSKILNGTLIIPKLLHDCYNVKYKYLDLEFNITQLFCNNIKWQEKGTIHTYIEPEDNTPYQSVTIGGDYHFTDRYVQKHLPSDPKNLGHIMDVIQHEIKNN